MSRLDREGRPQDGAVPHTVNKHNPRTDELPAANRIINEISWMADESPPALRLRRVEKQIRRGSSPPGLEPRRMILLRLSRLLIRIDWIAVAGSRHADQSRESIVSLSERTEPSPMPT